MKVKLLTIWFGPLPKWFGQFQQRIASNHIIDWELITPATVREVNILAAACAKTYCAKATPYSLCDLRPLFGEMFADKYKDYDWWGWCDLDVIIGDLDSLLPPLLSTSDVISVEPHSLSGGMTILRNSPDICSLYHNGPYHDILACRMYCNFDEAGFEAPQTPGGLYALGFTQVVNESGLRVHYDDRSWHSTWQELQPGIPSRTCYLAGNKLIEEPTQRELLLYHFRNEYWPIV